MRRLPRLDRSRPPLGAGPARHPRSRDVSARLLPPGLRRHGGARRGRGGAVRRLQPGLPGHRHPPLHRARARGELARDRSRSSPRRRDGPRHRLPSGALGTHAAGGGRAAIRPQRSGHRALAADAAPLRRRRRNRGGVPHRRRPRGPGRFPSRRSRAHARGAGGEARRAGLRSVRRRGPVPHRGGARGSRLPGEGDERPRRRRRVHGRAPQWLAQWRELARGGADGERLRRAGGGAARMLCVDAHAG